MVYVRASERCILCDHTRDVLVDLKMELRSAELLTFRKLERNTKIYTRCICD